SLHRPVEGLRLPPIRVWGPVEDLRDTVRVDGELECVGPLRAEGALVDRAAGVALDVDELPALGVDELAAPYGTVRANALGDRRAAEPGRLRGRLRAKRLRPGRDGQAEHRKVLSGRSVIPPAAGFGIPDRRGRRWPARG